MSDESKSSGDEVFCVKCGEKVTVKSSLDTSNTQHNLSFIAECPGGSRCGWIFGSTAEEALANYSANQKWGENKIGELEDRLIGAEETIGELLQVEKGFEAYKRLNEREESYIQRLAEEHIAAYRGRIQRTRSTLTEEESKELEALKLYSEKMKANDKSQWGKECHHIPLSLDTDK
jgi:hypothetical protein